MKPKILIITLAGLLCWQAVACVAQRPEIVERPAFETRNTRTLEIDKIVRTDSSTLFYIDAYFHPKYWIMIAKDTYLQANGRKYMITGADSIQLGDYHWMPESGKSSFVLYFPPLPKSVDKVDFMEGECEDCFRIWGIDLTGKAKQAYPDEIRAVRKRKQVLPDSLPAPVIQPGETTVKIHLAGFRDKMSRKSGAIYINDFMTGEQREIPADTIASDGTVTVKFPQYATGEWFFVQSQNGFSAITDPGETIDVYIDLNERARRESLYRGAFGEPRPVLYSTGRHGALNQKLTETSGVTLLPGSYEEEILGMTGTQYTDYIRQRYERVVDSLEKTEQDPLLREYYKLRVKTAAADYFLSGGFNLKYAYMQANHLDWDAPAPDFAEPVFTAADTLFLRSLDLGRPSLLYFSEYPFLVGNLAYAAGSEERLLDITGTQPGILSDVYKMRGIKQTIDNLQPLSEEQRARIASTTRPEYYTAVFAAMEQQLKDLAEANKAKTGYTVHKAPEVSNAKLFETIVAPYKGKVVMVDFWDTWCGPCREGHRRMRSVKEELESEDIVYIYIADESSPMAAWMNMIPDIKGEHYRLNKEQSNYLSDQFKFTGIPTYMILDRSGQQTYFMTGFPGEGKLKSELNRALAH